MPRPKLEQPRFRLKLRRGVWQIEWTEAGQSKRQSTGCREEQAAQQFLTQFAATYGAPEEPDRKSVEAILDGYLADRKGQAIAYTRLVEASRPLKARLGWLDATDIRPSTSRQYARNRGVGANTVIKELSTLRAAFNWAVRERWLDRAPAVVMPPRPAHRDRWLTDAECAALIAACNSPHVRLFVAIALNTAARKNAIETLTWMQVDLKAGRIDFNPPGRARTGKGRPVVPINDSLYMELDAAYGVRTCDNVLEWAGRPAGNVKRSFSRAAERAGLKGITPHVLRHTCATRMARAGVRMEKIQQMLGHSSIAITSGIYAHWHPDWLADAAQTLG